MLLHLIDQLPIARLVSGGQLNQAVEICERKTARDTTRSDLFGVLMLCHWWQGEHDVAFKIAEQILGNSKSPERSAIEVAGSYCATRPQMSVTMANMQRLADTNHDAGSRLILSNPAWFARSISRNRSARIDTRVQSAVSHFTTARLAHVEWANAWLAADSRHRPEIPPPPI